MKQIRKYGIALLIVAVANCRSTKTAVTGGSAAEQNSLGEEEFLNADTLAVIGSGRSKQGLKNPKHHEVFARQAARADAENRVLDICAPQRHIHERIMTAETMSYDYKRFFINAKIRSTDCRG